MDEQLVRSVTHPPGGIQRIGGSAMEGKELRGFVRVRNLAHVGEAGKSRARRGERRFSDENMGNGSMRLARK